MPPRRNTRLHPNFSRGPRTFWRRCDKDFWHGKWPADSDLRQRHLYDEYSVQEAGLKPRSIISPPRVEPRDPASFVRGGADPVASSIFAICRKKQRTRCSAGCGGLTPTAPRSAPIAAAPLPTPIGVAVRSNARPATDIFVGTLLMAFKLFVSAAKGISSLQLSRPISRAASTPQDGTSATRAEDPFTKCVSCGARGRRCTYLIV